MLGSTLLGAVLLFLEVLVPFEGSDEVHGEVGLNDLSDGLHVGVLHKQSELGRCGGGTEVADGSRHECAHQNGVSLAICSRYFGLVRLDGI